MEPGALSLQILQNNPFIIKFYGTNTLKLGAACATRTPHHDVADADDVTVADARDALQHPGDSRRQAVRVGDESAQRHVEPDHHAAVTATIKSLIWDRG